MTLADRLDALLTRPIYECDLETIREAARRLRALERGRGAMTDIVERLRFMSYPEAGMAADEITRLRTERSELIEALEEAKLQINYLHKKFSETGTGNAVLAKIEAALLKAKGEA